MGVHVNPQPRLVRSTVSYTAENHHLLIRLEDPQAPSSGSLRSWTPFDTTFDYDRDRRIRGIEVMLPSPADMQATLPPPKVADGYFDLIVDQEYQTPSEAIAYDVTRKLLRIAFSDKETGPAYRLSFDTWVQLDGSSLTSTLAVERNSRSLAHGVACERAA